MIDYTPFDDPALTSGIFYPQRVWSPPPRGVADYQIPVAANIAISARSYGTDRGRPNILFFHGNGEVACQYDDIAPLYAKAGANLFVADFRGYGRSEGNPGFSTMLSDARFIFEFFAEVMRREGFTGPLFVKGRSLGSQSAVEIAAAYGDRLAGLISESGSTSVGRLVRRFGLSADSPAVQETIRRHDEKVAGLTLPLLVIHGERDEIIPLEYAIEFYNAAASKEKYIEIIPNAGHNDLLWVGGGQYFEAVRAFMAGRGAPHGLSSH